VLGCGEACREYGELSAAAVVIVTAPDDVLPGLIAEMANSELEWQNRTVVLFDTHLGSLALAPLERRGALTASLSSLSALPETLLIEGHPEAVRRIRRILRNRRLETVEIRRGAKVEYLKGVKMGTTLFFPTIAGTIDQFRKAGMQKAAAEKTAAWLFDSSLRAYFRAGKRLLRGAGRKKPGVIS
jgi:hypothetical protein